LAKKTIALREEEPRSSKLEGVGEPLKSSLESKFKLRGGENV